MDFILAKVGGYRGGEERRVHTVDALGCLGWPLVRDGTGVARGWVEDVSDLSTRYEGCGSGCRVCPLSCPLTVWAGPPKLPSLGRLEVSLDT